MRLVGGILILFTTAVMLNLSLAHNSGSHYFSLRLYREGALQESSECFSSNCTDDQNVHFYLEELYQQPYINDPCDYADSLINNLKGEDLHLAYCKTFVG